MVKSFIRTLAQLTIFILVMGVIQAGFLVIFLNQVDVLELLLKIWTPLVFLTILIFLAVQLIKLKSPTKMGFGYLVGSILKMLASLICLLPDLLNKNDSTTNYALNFVVAFFILMFYEVYVVVLELKKPQNKTS